MLKVCFKNGPFLAFFFLLISLLLNCSLELIHFWILWCRRRPLCQLPIYRFLISILTYLITRDEKPVQSASKTYLQYLMPIHRAQWRLQIRVKLLFFHQNKQLFVHHCWHSPPAAEDGVVRQDRRRSSSRRSISDVTRTGTNSINFFAITDGAVICG